MKKIAIIGLSCLLPGANTPESYWQNLIKKKDLTSLATGEQMGVDANIFYDHEKGKTDKYYCLRGGYIHDFQFEPSEYKVAPEIWEELDPIYQWSLYVAKQALQDSGYLENKSILSQCGVILGNLSFPTRYSHHLFSPIYHQSINSAVQELLASKSFQLQTSQQVSLLNGNISGYPAALIAQALSLSGTNFSLDAACASSLYSIKIACDYLLTKKADLMLAGAVSCADPFFINMGFSIFQAYPEDGISRPLNKSSEGLIAGEGAGMIVLKRYEDALRDRDRVYAVINGIGLSNDGKGKFVLSPHPKGQILAFERAYSDAGINPHSIDYLECHATGTPLGDMTELNSMEAFFSQYNASPLLGSVKSNLGHLLTASGIASLIKVILSMNKNLIPPTINISEPLKSETGKIGGDRIVTSTMPWEKSHKHAAVSAFGFGGCNAHLILENIDPSQQPFVTGEKKEVPLTKGDLGGANTEKLAIIGMDAFFGGCDGLDNFDRTIYEGKQHFIPLPPQRWQGIESENILLKNHGFTDGKVPKGAYIKDFEFDFLRFKIPPKEEDQLIPQQLLLIKVADRAIQDSGLKKGGNIAVIVAMETELSLHQYRGRVDLSWQIKNGLKKSNLDLYSKEINGLESIAKDSIHPAAGVNQYTSFIGNVMASRVSALWDFTGPAFTISAGENSVFKALEIAQLMLSSGEVDAVVLGAIDLAGGVESVLLRQQITNINTGVNTLSFDENSDGWMIGEGAGAIVLKRYQTAQKDEDKIYAVIEGISFVKNNREKYDSESVKEVCQKVFKTTGIKPNDIGYLEVFASGISAEDETEIKGILQAYQDFDPPQPPLSSKRGEKKEVLIKEDLGGSNLTCCLGSIKSNIGHTYAASGIASLIKTALCLYYRYIPATPNWTKPKQLESWKNSPFYVSTESRTWFLEEDQSQRMAAINGLGIDNTYVHLILSEEVSQKERISNYLQQTPLYLFPIYANNQESLLTKVTEFQDKIKNPKNLSLLANDLYQSFQKSIDCHYKLILVAHNSQELRREINLAITGINKAFVEKSEWKTPNGSYFTTNPLNKKGKIAFVYPGMGSADIGLGKDIFRLFPNLYDTFSNLVIDVNKILHEKLTYPRSLIHLSTEKQIEQTEQFFSNGVAMCQSNISLSTLYTIILKDYFKIEPQIAFGYSLGEASGMLFALGVWKDKYHLSQESATMALESSPLFKTGLCGDCNTGRKFLGLALNLTGKQEKFWISYLLKASLSQVKEIIKHEEKVYLTFINTPNEVVIAGNPNSCLRVIKKLNCNYLTINFDSVLHCEIAKYNYDELVQLHSIPIQNIPKIDFYSGINYATLNLDINILANNSAKICCQTIDFPRLVKQIYQDGAKIFIEVGAKNNCSKWISENLQNQEHLAVSINSKSVDDHTGIIRILAKLISHGVALDLSRIYPSFPKISSQDKSIIKKVTLGGEIIQEKILSLENQEKFKVIASKIINKKEEINTLNSQQYLKIAQIQIAVSQQLINDHLAPENQIKIEPSNIIWNEDDLLEFAQGNIANVFGDEYAIIDSYSRKVRLPLPPYLLVSRVTKLDAKKGEFKPSSMTTEYDIPYDAWYSVDGQVPGCITVESGQCDLLLISYLGIDFENKGKLVYRLLDCTLTFLDEFPKEGDILRYNIKINSFAKSVDNLLFFFSYECFVKDKIILKMTGGCAGFFSDEQLEKGKGIILSDREKAHKNQIEKQKFEPLLVCNKSSFNQADILNLTQGNLADCFGDHYAQYGLNKSLRFPPQKILMIDQITTVESTGGDWGLGLIIAEKNLEPDHWYFPCHFKDDRVLAGSLMSEGCSQLLQFYLLYVGLHTFTNDARFQPIYEQPQVVRCRGQVTPISAKLIYRLEIKEIGLYPNPYAKCDVDIILQDKIVVNFQNLGLQLIEKNPDYPGDIQSQKASQIHPKIIIQKPALLTEEQVQEFCIGSVAKCFGAEFKIYDDGIVKASRMPNTHLSLVSRVLEVKGQRHQIKKGSTIITEYDVPINPWYYRQNSSETVPYSILMEIGLQPCGFLSTYLGTTLLYPDRSLYFRNLDGEGTILKDIDIRGKTITNTSTLISSTNVQGIIIQKFNFQLVCDDEIFYQGSASFGHFSPESLVNQVGLDQGKNILPWYETGNNLNIPEINLDLRTQESRNKYYQINNNKPYYRLAKYQLDLLNEVKIIENGGNYQQGYIYARKDVKLTDWYFKCHFHQDPVMPGSLGVEAMIQAMQVYALHLDLGKHLKSPHFIQIPNHKIVWKYRGQIPPNQPEMYLEIHLNKIEIKPNHVIIIGDCSLWKPNLRIYEVQKLSICLVDQKSSCK